MKGYCCTERLTDCCTGMECKVSLSDRCLCTVKRRLLLLLLLAAGYIQLMQIDTVALAWKMRLYLRSLLFFPPRSKGDRSFRASRSENPHAKSPGVSDVARIFSLDALFSSKKLKPFLVVVLKTQADNAADCFTVRIKQIKRSDMVTLLPKQSNRQGGARAVDLPARSFDLTRPGIAPPLVATPLNLQRGPKSKLLWCGL